ncbi:MAG: helix-turn-helix transcriptional regulator [Anaerolineales bacterium]|nr:helix-turn-helix transcriptional regulator [Anaerolineales bacterium]MCK5428586.1 helix-turn-helix transcriptional regulator [Anaerolineales bacterium]
MINDKDLSTTIEKLTQELRRGMLVLATLSQLREPKYGYALIDELSRQGLDIEQGTLYPLLRRLEDQGLLESEWNVDGSRPRRYYRISPTGDEVLTRLITEWEQLTGVIERLVDEESSSENISTPKEF